MYRIIPVEGFDLVIFGASGDLSRRKILPSLYRRFLFGQMLDNSRIIGVSRSAVGLQGFRHMVRDSVEKFVAAQHLDTAILDRFLSNIDFVVVDGSDSGWEELRGKLRPDVVRAFYLSVGPDAAAQLARQIGLNGLTDCNTRLVFEKPFGNNLGSARSLNSDLATMYEESQIYRIDHYLGKETVQNLMALRFANTLFEPVWNSQYIDHVQITVAEADGVDGRGDYYDKSGAVRDMVQNHMMQLLCLIAMEPPSRLDPDSVRNEKLKVIKALRPIEPVDVVRGQYLADGEVAGYAGDVGHPDSRTESYVALRCRIDNWRWSRTPFYLRTGKRLSRRLSEIAVRFKMPPHAIFSPDEDWEGNVLALRLQPDEGITMHVTIKEPGPGGLRLTRAPLDMSFADSLNEESKKNLTEPYERLIMDVVRGNQTLFMRSDEVEAAWQWTDPIVARWAADPQPIPGYLAGSQGPAEADRLISSDMRSWRSI